MTTILDIKGMHCVSCKTLIEDVCKDMPGILACDVDVQAGKAAIEHDGTLNLEELKKEINGLGSYTVAGSV